MCLIQLIRELRIKCGQATHQVFTLFRIAVKKKKEIKNKKKHDTFKKT